ncbi:MAG TPA: NUDIX hydrolase [Gammaproteobacteria bacterium]|nr:NUDIX hydrolase [Gammaproteobacteria bacterium]
MKYCSSCGAPVRQEIPAGDNRHRHVCNDCDEIHYHNPNIVVGCVPQWQEQIILCRRAIEPRVGYWTMPAGYLEIDESTDEGARREAEEEAGIDVDIGELLTLINIPQIAQVHMIYLAELRTPDYAAGEESLEVQLFTEAEIPWDDLAFPTVKLTLEHFFADRQAGNFKLHSEVLRHHGRDSTAQP